MYVIAGATGNIGRRIAGRLLAEGKDVKVIGRDTGRLEPLVNERAVACVGDLGDRGFLSETFSGARAAFLLIPPEYQAENVREFQNRIGETISTALERSSIEYVVNLSSLGAHLPERTGPILGLHDQEQRLNKLEGIHILHLRPTYFMENLFPNIDLIKHQGINGTSLKGDLEFPIIATQDVAEAASRHLLELDFSGKSVRELLGPRDMSMNEMTRILGEAIAKPDLPYVQFAYEDQEKAMTDMGISADMARALTELDKSMNEEYGVVGTARTKENTTPTSFEEFARVFAGAYNAG